MTTYRRDFNETKYMSFLIKNDKLLEKYSEIWDKVSNFIRKGFDSEPVYNENYPRPKIKSYEGKIREKFFGDKIAKEGSQCICLSIILINSIFRTGKNYCSQVF